MVRSSQKRVYGVQNSQLSDKSEIGAIKGCSWLRFDIAVFLWNTSDTSLAFLDIKISIKGNGLCTSVYYKPTDSHSCLLYSSSHPSHVKNSIPFSQFLRLRRLGCDDSDFSEKSEAMCQSFDKRGYPVSVVQAGYHRTQ